MISLNLEEVIADKIEHIQALYLFINIEVNLAKYPDKPRRFCFQFPPSSMKSYCKIVADFSNFATILQEMWNSNLQLSPYEYPLEVQVDKARKMVYFICNAHHEGCKFFIKMKQQVTHLNDPCQTTKDANWKSMLCQYLDIKNNPSSFVTYYRTIVFKNEHNHSTMNQRSKICRSSKLDKKENESGYNPQKHKFNNVIDHYRRAGEMQAKKYNQLMRVEDGMSDDFDKIDRLRGRQLKHGVSSGFMDEINKQIDSIKQKINEQDNNNDNFSKQYFGDKVVFLCDYEEQLRKQYSEHKNGQTNQKQAEKQEIQINQSTQSKKKEKNEPVYVEVASESDMESQKSFKGEPCLYFYSSLQMQKNLEYYHQAVNILSIRNKFHQFVGSELERKSNTSYIFCSTGKNKECVIFAVAVICPTQNKLWCRKSLVSKFFALNHAKSVQTVILTHGDIQMMNIIEEFKKSEDKLQKLNVVFRIPFCHEMSQETANLDLNSAKNSIVRNYKMYYGEKTFTGRLTQSIFQHFYEQQKRIQKKIKDKQNSKRKKSRESRNKRKRFPLQNLYFPCAVQIQKLLMKMVFTLSSQKFGQYLLAFINQFCFSDFQIMLLQQQIMNVKQQIFISQMRTNVNRKFIGLNLLADLEGAITKNFHINDKHIMHSWTNQKIVKMLITKANQNNATLAVPSKFWFYNLGDFEQQMPVPTKQNYNGNSNSKDKNKSYEIPTKKQNEKRYIYEIQQPSQKSASQIQAYLIKKHPILAKLQCLQSESSAQRNSQTGQKNSSKSQQHKALMKRLPYYNQSSLYMTETSRNLIFDIQIISMLRYSCQDLSDRIIVGPGNQNHDVFVLVWNEKQIWGVKRSKKGEGLWQCQCGFSELVAMPCRHMLKAMRKYECNMITSVDQYWYKK